MRIASYSLLRGCGRLVACQRSPGNCPTSLAYTSRKFSVQKRNEDDSSKDSVEKTGDYNTNVAMRKPNAFEKFVLVYTKRYARKDQIPEYVPHTQILMANDKFRGRMLIRFMLLGFLGFVCVAMLGRVQSHEKAQARDKKDKEERESRATQEAAAFSQTKLVDKLKSETKKEP